MSERHELLAAVRARLQRVAAGQDLSPVLEPEAMTETRQLAGVLADDEGDRTEAQDDLAAALSVFAEAAQVGSAAPLTRIEAARHAAALAAPTDPGRAAGLLEAAVLLLPEVAPRQLRRGDQQYAIGRLAGLAGDAAALALADPAGTSRQRARRALRLLEAGRAVLLSQALDTRSDLTDLRQRHPDLATRFTDLRDRIDTGPADETVPPEPDSDTNAARWWDRLAQERRSLAGQMGATLARIRAQDGFASFALPGAPWPRVWWATGGLLGPLPLHAAGYHSPGPDAEPRTVMDRVVSSYTPTIRALRYARQHTPPPAAGVPDTAGQALIVAMPVTPGLPGQGRLPGVPAEIAMLRALLNQPVLLTEPDPGPGAPVDDAAAEHVPTRASVLARLPAAAIAHFACHGSTDPADPSQSRLLLHDHDAAPPHRRQPRPRQPRPRPAGLPVSLQHHRHPHHRTARRGHPPHLRVPAGRIPPRHRHPVGHQRSARGRHRRDLLHPPAHPRGHPQHQPRRPRPPPRHSRGPRQLPRRPLSLGRLPARRQLTGRGTRAGAAGTNGSPLSVTLAAAGLAIVDRSGKPP
jgi:hypothetical protein